MERGRLVLDALRTLARRTSGTPGVDDSQWLDLSSARTLRYSLRRLDTDPVSVLATTNVEHGAKDTLALVKSLPPGRVDLLYLGQLGIAD